ncbi:MAG: transporter substrate-binding domain-containing protein [Clostridia bacterium]|nr:transporter substrate-binding domain-containing protein [Clostridia bacterium]
MKRIVSILLCLLMALGLIAISACGTPTTAPPASTDAPGETEQPAASDVLICGITDFAPMNFRNDEGEWVGFDTEFAMFVGQKLGMTVEFQEIVWAQKYLELNSGTINCIWNGFTANSSDDGKARGDLVDFSYSYLLNNQCIVVKADKAANFKTLEDLAGKTVAAEAGSAGENAARDAIGDAGTFVGAEKQTDALVEVLSGAVDCAIVDVLLAQEKVGEGDMADLAIAEIEMKAEIYAIGFAKGSELTAKVNMAIKALYDEGALQLLAEKYGLENLLKLDFDFPPAGEAPADTEAPAESADIATPVAS